MTENVSEAISSNDDGMYLDVPYVLLTAAHNEEAYIAGVIESVVAQTVRPAKWVIISDRSTDRTDEIARSYCDKYDFIELLHVSHSAGRGTPSKVHALSAGLECVQGESYKFIGNLDCDILLPREYYARLLERFRSEPILGIAGGMIFEMRKGQLLSRPANRSHSVAHAAELVRKECFEAVGGYSPLKYGGEDWLAELSARMLGWETRSFSDLEVRHLRPTGGADTWHRHCFREGKADYSFGTITLFELLKCIARISEDPWIIGAIVRLAGYCWSYIKRDDLLVPHDVVKFLRNEQRQRILHLFFRGNCTINARLDA